MTHFTWFLCMNLNMQNVMCPHSTSCCVYYCKWVWQHLRLQYNYINKCVIYLLCPTIDKWINRLVQGQISGNTHLTFKLHTQPADKFTHTIELSNAIDMDVCNLLLIYSSWRMRLGTCKIQLHYWTVVSDDYSALRHIRDLYFTEGDLDALLLPVATRWIHTIFTKYIVTFQSHMPWTLNPRNI